MLSLAFGNSLPPSPAAAAAAAQNIAQAMLGLASVYMKLPKGNMIQSETHSRSSLRQQTRRPCFISTARAGTTGSASRSHEKPTKEIAEHKPRWSDPAGRALSFSVGHSDSPRVGTCARYSLDD